MTSNFFSPLSFVADPGSEIRDLGSGMGKNQDLGSGIRDKHPGSATLLKSAYLLLPDQLSSDWSCGGGGRTWVPTQRIRPISGRNSRV